MDNIGSFSATWKSVDGINMKLKLPIISFKEDNSEILYCPALDLSGYGLNEKESIDSFNHTLGEFLLYTTRKKTLASELQKLGWTLRKSKAKPMYPPTMSELLEKNKNFSRIFNNNSFKKFDFTVEMPIA